MPLKSGRETYREFININYMLYKSQYKGYIGSVEFSEEDGLFYGKVQGIRSLISYEGDNAFELISDFHSAVDDYLAEHA